MLIVNNKALDSLIRDNYSEQQVDEIYDLLAEQGTFRFNKLANGLFPASNLQQAAEYTGYNYTWVRDNIYVALAHYLQNRGSLAVENIGTLAKYFLKHKWRFEGIIDGRIDFDESMNRPHVRFEGKDLSEIDQKWAHAQNDALGYFLWLFCLLHNRGLRSFLEEERELLALFAYYFQKIRYWQDEDSGHWEETRKVEASSIGAVVRGLEELKVVLRKRCGEGFRHREKTVTVDLLDQLITNGRESLERILPAECIQPDAKKAKKNRPYDAALLFLVFPMNVAREEMADKIVQNVIKHLQGDYGIRRYLGDSFWSADYKKKLRPEERTIDFSRNIEARDSLLRPGEEEAQWCIFDPIVSIIYGLRYRQYRDERYLRSQIHYFNRSLGQLTGEESRFGGFKCPELYYREEGQYVPNDTVPLLWTQANLWMAFRFLKESVSNNAASNPW